MAGTLSGRQFRGPCGNAGIGVDVGSEADAPHL